MKSIDQVNLGEKDRQAIDEAVQLLYQSFPIEQIILYGSKARGMDDTESDIDLLLLTSKELDWKGRWHLREPNFSPNDMIFRQTGLITHGFYAASAVLLKAGKKFIKHSGVRGAIHQHLVNTGLLDIKWGKNLRSNL